jgi:tetratricopeptide (TPR) repeat protein
MKAPRHPRRLIHDPRLGPLVRAAAAQSPDAARLERSRSAILARIREAEAGGREPRPVVRLGPRRLVQAAVPLMLLVCATAGALFWLARPPSRLEHQPHAPALSPEPRSAADRAPALEELLQIGSDYQPPPEAPPAPHRAPGRPLARRVPPPEAPPEARAEPPTEPQPAPSAQLDEQIALFRAARRAARSGELERAVERLDALARRFPQSPLGAEARLLRVEVLYRQGRYRQAIARIEPLLDAPALAGKKAQLLRLLGDAWLQQGRCDRASAAFRRALGLGLQGAEARAARRGLQSCEQPQP